MSTTEINNTIEQIEQPKFAVLLELNLYGHIAQEVFITQTPEEIPLQVNQFVQAFNTKQDVIWVPNPSLQNAYRVSHVSNYHVSRVSIKPREDGAV